jgi:hypothetical protein
MVGRERGLKLWNGHESREVPHDLIGHRRRFKYAQRRTCNRDDVGPDERGELWKASVRAHEEKRRQVARLEWHAFHCGQAERHRATLQALIEHHVSEAARLMEATDERSLG